MQRFCFCCSLRTGCIVIAVFSIIIASLFVGHSVKSLIGGGFTGDAIAVLILGIVVLISAILLMQGIQKRRPALMTAWIVIAVIRLICLCGLVIVLILQATGVIQQTVRKETSYVVVEIVVEILDILFLIYCIIAVNAYKNQLRAENAGQPMVTYIVTSAHKV